MSDIPGNTSTNVTLNVGDTYNGTLDSNSDKDWVRMDLSPGEWVQVTQTSGSVDSYLIVYDANGNPITSDDAISGSNLNDAAVMFGGGAGGTYYVEAGSYLNGSSGAYTLEATSISAPSGDATDPLDSGFERSDTNITVHFVNAGQTSDFLANTANTDDVISEGWTTYERERVEAALASIAAVTGLTFTITTDTDADFQLIKDTNELNNNGLLGYFYYPNATGQSAGVFNGNGFGWNTTGGLEEGGLGYATLIHEFLHGLGLAHPHDGANVLPGVNYPSSGAVDDLGLNGLNQGVYTIMSYQDGLIGTNAGTNSGNSATPMALDIAELQDLYGTATNNTGDDDYQLQTLNGWHSIWDTGGTDDTISYNGSGDVVIDLRPATLTYAEGGGGYISQVSGAGSGFTIANGVTIENASGGSGDDLLIGNDVGNGLDGNGGDDVLLGGAGDDDISGGSGDDTASGGIGDDTITGDGNNDTLMGDSGSDDVSDTSGTNTIFGGSGYDTLNGGSGRDTIYGGSGNDTITGGGNNDTLMGDRGNDSIDGGAGNDTIIGGLGQDQLTGGSNTDTFVFNSIVDSLASQSDTITDFTAGDDIIDLGNVASGTLSIVGAFTGMANEVVLNESGGNTTVQIDVNGDGIAEMEIFVQNEIGLSGSDFIL